MTPNAVKIAKADSRALSRANGTTNVVLFVVPQTEATTRFALGERFPLCNLQRALNRTLAFPGLPPASSQFTDL